MTIEQETVWKSLIKEFLDENENSLKLDYHPLTKWAKLLSELGFTTYKNGGINLMDDGNSYDTNGWQVDFWWKFKHENGNAYMISGSLFYGDFSLSLD